MNNQLACLKISKGDFEKGFPVSLIVWQESQGTFTSYDGQLPGVPTVSQSYHDWHSSYRQRGIDSSRQIDRIEGQVTNISIDESASELEQSFNNWLNSGAPEFRLIRDKLIEVFGQNSQTTRFVISTDEVQLWKLPWHLWDVLDHQYKLEPSFSPINIKKREAIAKNLTEKVRILVILGDSTDINVDADLQILKENLPDAEIHPLLVFDRQQLSDKLWGQNWDILFFAGHSGSDLDTDQGKIYINATESITIQELKDGLENAIQYGLKLAIFNSCLGLGIAKDLASLQMPAIIVMRERIPDLAAQKFLEYFLTAFKHKSLQDSVREARKRLKETVDTEHPCASWLPILFENPTQESPTWIRLRKAKEQSFETTSYFTKVTQYLVTSKKQVSLLFVATIASYYVLLPQLASVLNKRGVEYLKKDELPIATNYFIWSLKLQPNQPSALNNLGYIYEQVQEIDLARYYYNQSKLLLSPHGCNNEARLYILDGIYKRAENLLRQCFDFAKRAETKIGEAMILKNQGWVFLKTKDYESAQQSLQKAIELSPDLGAAYCLLAQVYEAQNQQKNAKSAWENCRQYASDDNPEEVEWKKQATQRISRSKKANDDL